MMWSLIPLEGEEIGKRFRLLAGCQYKLGRSSCDFNIPGDKSISRHHATLEVQHPEANVAHPHKPPELKLTDFSKFGTFIQDEKVTRESIIKNSDVIKFGTMSSIFTAVYEPYVATTSCLDPAAKKQTKQLLSRLGGHMVSDWRKECQLLVMTSLSVTVKVICALVSQKPIVTVQYLEKLAKSISEKQELPDPNHFIPPLAESQLNPNEVSFQMDVRRKTLFQGKIFIFLNPKQFKKLNIAVELAGGTPMLMEEGTDDNEDDILLQSSTCIMHCDPGDMAHPLSQNAQDWIKHVFSVLKRNGRRPIPDCELGFAVLYCSTNRYCNPAIEAGSQMSNIMTPSSTQQGAASAAQSATPDTSRKRKTRATEEETDEESHPAPKVARTRQKQEESKSSQSSTLRTRSRSPNPISHTNRKSSPSGSRHSLQNPPSPSQSKTSSAQPETQASSRRRVAQEISEIPTHSAVIKQEEESEGEKRTRTKQKLSTAKEEETREVSPEPAHKRSNIFSRSRTKNSENKDEITPPINRAVKTEAEDAFDVFDDFKPRGRRRKSRSPSPSPSPSPTTSPFPSPPPGKRDRIADTALVKEEPKSAVKDRTRRGKTADVKQQEENTIPEERKVSDTHPTKASPKSEEAAFDYGVRILPVTTDNWLSTKTPLAAQLLPTKVKEDPDGDPIIEGGMTTVFKTLLVSTNQDRHKRSNNHSVKKSSKNFKRFKKVMPAGSEGLPRIIGGSDLKLHINSAREVDEWFEEEQRDAKHKSELSQEADALFSWDPAVKKRSGRR